MQQQAEAPRKLPENAYTRLQPGESYTPLVPPNEAPPELTPRAIAWGLFFCIIFTVASSYSTLKVGQGMEAAIPISILAIGLARLYSRRSTILENVIITGFGGVGGSVVAGATFTLPALYILKLDPHPFQTTLIALAGACLGTLLLIPLRRYFVKETHGLMPYPEATAITEVLVTGERGGSQARLLLQATAIAGVYDFFVTTFHVWKENVDLLFTGFMQKLSTEARIAFNFDAISFILGLGYVMGLRSSMVLCAGGFLSNFVLVPVIWMIGSNLPENIAVYPAVLPIAKMSAAQIFRGYVRFIGVGAIATAGIFGILKSLRVLGGSMQIAFRAFHAGGTEAAAVTDRTDHDIPIVKVLLGVILCTVGIAVILASLSAPVMAVAIGVVLVLLFSFFFTSVGANAIATIARNPVSGMTMLTVIISSIVLLNFGVSGSTGMFFVMAIAGLVCTALSVAGQAATDFKAGYWIGSTPAAQQKARLIAGVASAIAVSLTLVMLAQTFQFGEAVPGDNRVVLAAPQASIMKALVEGFMSRQPVAWLLFGCGAMIAVIMEMLGAPALIFALGMYLPLELNSPALIGGILSHFITRRSEQTGGEAGRTIRERGVIIASGLMAGGALGGVFGAALRLIPSYTEDWIRTPFYDHDPVSQSLSIFGFVALCVYTWKGSMKKA